MSDAGLERDPAAQGRVVAALAGRAIRVQFRRAQFLIPAFLLPLVLLAVIASGTSAARNLPAFPDTGAYVGFVVGGTLMQGALLAGLTAGIALAADIEGGFFDRLLTAPLQRVTIILGRVVAAGLLGRRPGAPVPERRVRVRRALYGRRQRGADGDHARRADGGDARRARRRRSRCGPARCRCSRTSSR